MPPLAMNPLLPPCILVCLAAAQGASAQSAYLKAPHADAFDEFGTSVAVSGNFAVVGALAEGSNATGVDGDASNNAAPMAGAAYVYEFAGGAWQHHAYLKASNAEPGDRFGVAVAISGDLIAVGAIQEDSGSPGVDGDQADNSVSQAGAVYVFRRDGGSWVQEAYLKASTPSVFGAFGQSLSLDADTLVVGGDITGPGGSLPSDAGAAYVFVRSSSGTWSEQAILRTTSPSSSPWFGHVVGVSGDVIVVGDPFDSGPGVGVNPLPGGPDNDLSGAAFVFERTGSTWDAAAYIKASNPNNLDQFDISVAVDGDTIAVGAMTERSAATGIDGDQGDNSALGAGAVYVYQRGVTSWEQRAYVKASNTGEGARFGSSVAVNGDALAVGSAGERSAATEINGDTSDISLDRAGAAYLFRRSQGTWEEVAFLKAPNPDSLDLMGSACALGSSHLVVGAFGEDGDAASGATTAFNDGAQGAGAAYAYELAPLSRAIGQGICPAVPGPTGAPAALFGLGSPTAQDNDLTLVATGLVPGTFGFLVTSQEDGFLAAPGGSAGDLCIASLVMGRYSFAMQSADASGRMVQAIDLTQVPGPDALVPVLAGETRYWQLWYRMPLAGGGGQTSNFSSAVRIQFL